MMALHDAVQHRVSHSLIAYPFVPVLNAGQC